MSAGRNEAACLDKPRHVKYWTRCLKTLLPHHYTGNESNRMYLAFFIISALDLLDSWHSMTNEQERKDYVDWIYHCQHPKGGFRMWPGTDFGVLANEDNARWDPANVPATYFALSALLVVGDDLKRVKRRETLDWLRQMQRDDGSFGETLVHGVVEGGMDPRFGYCATGARRILRGDIEDGPLTIDGVVVEDIDVDKHVKCVQLAESFDGGLADQPFHEPHAGYTFCSLGCLKFIGRLRTSGEDDRSRPTGPSDLNLTLSWLVNRQTDLLDPDAEDEDITESAALQDGMEEKPKLISDPDTPIHQSPDKSTVDPADVMTPFGPVTLEAGMNGRTNKVADTCYAWWTCGALHMLDQPTLYNKELIENYLLGKTQHSALGGFGKYPGDLPDLYHSYLGLAALGLGNVDGIKAVCGTMCISKEASARVHSLWGDPEQ
ncbi:Geranylgeranyl transferase type-1 subunit beta [Fulvia fulva]|uniref:Geranylgeranyl transferase type-1 subunit beta n=1 Tax=Passalora fulva TaxID=5499 RepID=A0A9Q8PI88_PASFU|nr:Geranylgeranyl transferase type-1 subunit beta [Fulvia fulva]KAK4615694.1 Geranylgeranyl transferase type-1 subunit beta [Fulvia fulva]KAK4617409.1 Geranylgeranyl transferase type-1 subunit beta [Fulvia fulva]UJO22965.1 Geranylgeranyl transferase type-1 subunit beta [Fulvia fulva]WPV19434.1 Geranylgeranyl transferase type-1 subunit beta [Fulvia fulva]WPV34069.1 Geranylgeranyl transferase type-1 subunit beta [Fulvia fulva]